MKRVKTVIVLVLVCLAQSARAEPMGTAFTYQGQLYDANYPANGSYDFAFKLYDADSDGNKVGMDVNLADVDVVDGYFTVELDFGSDVFNGGARWLDAGVRPSEENDPNSYTTLIPRQEVTPTPYALQTRGIFVDDYGDISIETGPDSYTKLLLHMDGTDGSTIFIDSATGKLITVNGDAQMDTAQSTFGGASGLFDGNGDYLSLADSNDWNFGTGDFTIEFWVRLNNVSPGVYSEFLKQRQDIDNYFSFAHYRQGEGPGSLGMVFVSGGVTKAQYHALWQPTADTWYHIAFVRNGTTGHIFVDGTALIVTEQIAFGTNDVGDVTADLWMGYNENPFYFDGWLDELRISKGIARWTSNFNVPTKGYSDGKVVINGNVGIGTTDPDEKLHITGSIKIVDGSQGANKVLTSDATGKASWQSTLSGLRVYDSGWFAVTANTNYSKTHNLGTTAVHVLTYSAQNSNGTGNSGMMLEGYTITPTGGEAYGIQLYNISTTQVSIFVQPNGFNYVSGLTSPITSGYARIIMLALE